MCVPSPQAGGIVVSFLGVMSGVIDHNHLGGVMTEAEWRDKTHLKPPSAASAADGGALPTVRARVLMVDTVTKTVSRVM